MSVMLASPIPLISASRAAGAAITSANEPKVAPRLRPKQQRFQQFVIRQRFRSGRAKTLAQALAVPVIVRRRLGKTASVFGLLFEHGFAGKFEAV
jgi:hypothetical protein